MSDYKCPHCEYYMWEGKEFYECELEQENKIMKFKLDTVKADYEASEQENAELKAENDCFGHTGYNNCCACTDCVMKQIVELCRHYKKHSDCGRDCPSFGMFLSKLLGKLDI